MQIIRKGFSSSLWLSGGYKATDRDVDYLGVHAPGEAVFQAVEEILLDSRFPRVFQDSVLFLCRLQAASSISLLSGVRIFAYTTKQR